MQATSEATPSGSSRLSCPPEVSVAPLLQPPATLPATRETQDEKTQDSRPELMDEETVSLQPSTGGCSSTNRRSLEMHRPFDLSTAVRTRSFSVPQATPKGVGVPRLRGQDIASQRTASTHEASLSARTRAPQAKACTPYNFTPNTLTRCPLTHWDTKLLTAIQPPYTPDLDVPAQRACLKARIPFTTPTAMRSR
jgi:hypothetical protein